MGGEKLFKFSPPFHISYLTLSYSSGSSPSPTVLWPSSGFNNLCSSSSGSNAAPDSEGAYPSTLAVSSASKQVIDILAFFVVD